MRVFGGCGCRSAVAGRRWGGVLLSEGVEVARERLSLRDNLPSRFVVMVLGAMDEEVEKRKLSSVEFTAGRRSPGRMWGGRPLITAINSANSDCHGPLVEGARNFLAGTIPGPVRSPCAMPSANAAVAAHSPGKPAMLRAALSNGGHT